MPKIIKFKVQIVQVRRIPKVCATFLVLLNFIPLLAFRESFLFKCYALKEDTEFWVTHSPLPSSFRILQKIIKEEGAA